MAGREPRPGAVVTSPVPYDPNSEVGKRVTVGLEAVLADAVTRLHNEGLPVPDLTEQDTDSQDVALRSTA